MSQDPHGSPASTRVEELRRTQQKRQQRALIGFAVAEGFVLAIAVIVVYVLQLVEPVVGVWLLVAIALVGGGLLSTYLVMSMRRNQRELTALTGD